MSKKRIIKSLTGLGLERNEVQAYLFLAIQGPHKLKKIAVALNQTIDSIIISLNELQNLGIVRSSVDDPGIYIALPFGEVIDLFIDLKKEQAKTMQESREELLSSWRETIKKEIIKK